MTDDRWARAKQILSDLLDADPDAPAAWLDKRCGDDEALRAEVESLFVARTRGPLSDEADAADWLSSETPLPQIGRLSFGVDRPEVGADLGGYRLLKEIGVGGMSVVYRAERADADFEQTVAVKLLQRRLHADNAEQRFRAEQQVLARLDHPNIARLLDGGLTEGDRPYLVMEYVDGRPITEYAADHDLGLEARLDLLEQVMEAVRAAHRQLVVHRDLKPSNVLVTETEAGPQVKLLDFGIAKLLDDSMPVTRPETRTGHHLMTPSYAAPEQVTGDEITTATDVYQLGMLAYELLAETRPFDLDGKSLTEIERTVLEETPPNPSEATDGAGARLRGDLDTIIQKCLRKEPERRYSSIGALAADLRRYRNGKPVEARPATLGYRTRKFLQRHRWGVGVATLFVVTIALAGILLVQQRNRARREAETAEQVSGFLTSLFEASNPVEAQGDPPTAPELLRRGVRRARALEGQPDVKAQMLNVIGEVHLEKGRYAEAESLFVRALSLRRQAGANQAEIASVLGNLGYIQYYQRDYSRADSLLRKALQLHSSGPSAKRAERAEILRRHGQVLLSMDRMNESEEQLRAALQLFRSTYEAPHRKIAETLNSLAMNIHQNGPIEEAERLYKKTLAMQKKVLSVPHPDLADTINNLAYVMKVQDKSAQRERYHRQALRMDTSLYGRIHPYVALDYRNWAGALVQQNECEEAVPRFRRALHIREKLTPHERNDFREMYYVNKELGKCFVVLEKYDRAESSLEKALSLQRREEFLGNEERRKVFEAFVDLYEAWNKPSRAVAYRDSLSAMQ